MIKRKTQKERAYEICFWCGFIFRTVFAFNVGATDYYYDEYGQLIKTDNGTLFITKYSYDERGNLLSEETKDRG